MNDVVERFSRELERMARKAVLAAATPLKEDLDKAHSLFLEKETRDVFYRAATLLVDLSIEGTKGFTLAEAIAVLLQTWNRSYYQYRPWNHEHLKTIESALGEHMDILYSFRHRELSSFSLDSLGEQIHIFTLVSKFEEILGAVGAAKALHLVAPRFFPLWDRSIARKAYSVPVNSMGYLAMVRATKAQCLPLVGVFPGEVNVLKRLDEYNYCRYTKGWLAPTA